MGGQCFGPASVRLKNEPAIAEGLTTGCVLPLISRNGVLGVLALGRREDILLASRYWVSYAGGEPGSHRVENATTYGQIEEAKAELEKLSRKLRS